MTPAEFQTAWTSLQRPTTNNDLDAREVASDTGVWVARDNADHPHLLVLVNPDSEFPVDRDSTHGLSIGRGPRRVTGRGDAEYIDLACLDVAVAQTFATVAADIASVAIETAIGDRPTAVIAAIREWRWFWGIEPGGMSRKNAVGLFGELWFLNRWAGVTPVAVAAWGGSENARHDFQWTTSSVEVKTTSRSGPIVHTIEHLEQLENPESGQLFLYSLRIARDSLASNSVQSLANVARKALREEPISRDDLMAKLARRGYTPAGGDESEVRYRIIEENLYRVDAGFPRLTRMTFPQGLPGGITSVSYQLDMTSCGEWCIASAPEAWSP